MQSECDSSGQISLINDIEMMQEAGMIFAMKNAHEDIKKIADFITESNDDFGVEMMLESLVNQSK